MTSVSPVVITWVDSSLQNGQVDKADFPKPAVIHTIGYVVERQCEHITLARDEMGEGDYRGLVCIPVCCVIGEQKCRVAGDEGWDQ